MSDHGIHHVTAITGNARRNLDFYTRTLGLRLVKKTVNFDDPGAYHLYFGDAAGTPGSIMTFFTWENAAPGTRGVGEQDETSFRIPLASVGFWLTRLQSFGVDRETRFGQTVLSFTDPDGMRLALVGVAGLEAEPAWTDSDIAAADAIRGFYGVRLVLAQTQATADVLTDVFGFAAEATEGDVTRYRVPGVAMGGVIDLRQADQSMPARSGGGSVHHLAFRAVDDAHQAAMAATLAQTHGLHATAQKDRDYFRSVYFRSPGGVLFEIATDAPGFAVDEPAASLGTALQLPRFLQPRRAEIEASLPALV